jgi:hypothetical protein
MFRCFPGASGFSLPPFDVIFVHWFFVVVHVSTTTLAGRRHVSLFLQLVPQLELVLYIRHTLVSPSPPMLTPHSTTTAVLLPPSTSTTDSPTQPLPILQTVGQPRKQLDISTHPACRRTHHHISRCHRHHPNRGRRPSTVERDCPERPPARALRADSCHT